MSLFGKKERDAVEISESLYRRAERLSQEELFVWAEQAVYTTGRYLNSYRRESAPEYLQEARSGAEALLVILERLRRAYPNR